MNASPELPFPTIRYQELQEWIEPENAVYMGNYTGGRHARVSRLGRSFIVTLDKEYDGKLYNFSVAYKDGKWTNTTKKVSEIKILAVHEVIEAVFSVFPLPDADEGLELRLRPTWTTEEPHDHKS